MSRICVEPWQRDIHDLTQQEKIELDFKLQIKFRVGQKEGRAIGEGY